ncbi:MAG TPA: GGDEF domain-containing protein [Candidatus Limnocylindrales bacterium]|nr:GGDEF domain-containing protein [Candidatus Limnocylindrales bacterium]
MHLEDRYDILAGLAAVALAPVAVATLLLFAPLRPTAVGVGWLPVLAGGIAAAAGAIATVPSVARGLRSASPQLIARAGALGTLTVGLSVTTLQAIANPASFPAASLAVAAPLAAAILLAVSWLPREVALARENVLAATLVLFGALEGSLAAALLVPPAASLAPWLLGGAAILAAASAIRGPWLPSALVAASLVSVAASRAGSLDALPGMLALGAGLVAFAVNGSRQERKERQEHQGGSGTDTAQVPLRPTEARTQPAPLQRRMVARDAGALDPPAADDEATRLARELRGTIVELLQARRTIELQREEIVRGATVDPLTGAASRHAIIERLRVEAAEARRYNHPVALVLLDIDGFTTLGRDHGTDVGDEVLREVALRLRLRMRSADALGRVGADSFLALLPHTDETGAATFAQALLDRLLSRPVETRDGELTLAVSIGIALMRPGMAVTDDELLAESETALASARAAGGNRIAFDRLHGLLRLDERRQPAEDPSSEAADGSERIGPA